MQEEKTADDFVHGDSAYACGQVFLVASLEHDDGAASVCLRIDIVERNTADDVSLREFPEFFADHVCRRIRESAVAERREIDA